MPIRDKVYNKLKSLGLTDSKEDFFNYYDNDENVRKDVYRRLREDGLRNSEDEFYSAMKPQKVIQQPEDDAVFEANAERFRNGQPIDRVTTQSVIDANPELGLQTNAVQPENPKWNVPQYDWRTDQQKKLDELNNSTTATPVQDQYGNEYYPVKPREVAYDEAVKGLKDISERKAETKSRLQTISNDVSNELNRLQSQVEVSDLDKFRPANLQSMPVNPVNQELMPEYTALRKAQRLVEESNNIIEEASKKGNTNFMAGLARGFWDNLNAEDYTFGADDAAQSAFLYRALDKAEKGESLTKAEETLLDAAAINMAVQSYYAQDLGKGYGAGQVTAESIPFMLEMAINPISTSGKTTAKALLNYGLKKFAKNKAAKVGARLAGDALAATGMAATTGFGDVLEGTTDRLAQNYNYQLDDEGRLHVEKKDDTMGMGEAFARSFATRAIENQSEMIFKAFEPIGGFMKGVQDILPGGVNKFFEMLGNNKAADAYRAIKNSPVFRNYLVKDIRNATQIGGLGEEYLEEVYNNIANAAIGEMKWEDVVSLDKNIDTLLGLAPTQVMFGLLGLGGAGAMRYQTRKTLEDLQATMNEQQRKDLEGLLDMGLDAKEVDVRGFIRNVMQNESYTIENKRDLIKAAYNVAKQNGIDELTEADTIDKVNAENSLIDSVTDPSTGIYTEITATLPDAKEGTIEVPGYVVGWLGEGEKRQPIFVQEGMENTYENRRVLKPGQWSEEAVQQMPAEEVKAINEEMIREEAAQQAEQEAKYAPEVLNAQMQQGVPFDTPNAQIIPVAPMPEGNGWIVEEYALDTNNKVAKTPIVRELTNDEYRDMLQAQLNAEEAAQKQLEEQATASEVVEEVQPTEESDVKENLTTESVNNLSPVEEVAQPQAPVIPTKEDGSIDFVSYGKEGTFKTLGEKYGEKMPNKVAVTAKALAEDLKKAQNKLQKAEEAYDNAPIGREQKAEEARDKAKQELESIQREANFWAEMDAEIKDAQARRESILNPQAEVETSTEPMNVDEFVAQQLASGNIILDKEDYKKETGYGDTEANAMNGGATKLFGKNGMTIQEAGERLMEIDRESGTNFFDQLDSNSGRDALINVLGSVKSRKELNQYIASNRSEQAKKESEGLRNELEKQAMEANYASLEDYVLQMEVEEMENPFLNDRADEIMAIFAEEAAKYEQSLNNTENGQGTENEVVEGNDSILPEEQLDNTGGTEVSEESERIGDGTSEESERTYAEEVKEPLRNRAKDWENKLGVKVNLIESIDQVTNRKALRAIQNGQRVTGWFEESTGEVCFYMPYLESENEVDSTYIHEVVAHKGLRELLGDKFDAFCDEVWDMMSNADRLKFMAYPGVSHLEGKEKARAAADEYIAHLSENIDVTDSAWNQLTELIKKFLKAIGLEPKMTNADIANAIKKSYQRLLEGEGGSSLVGEGTRFNAKKVSDRRQDRNRVNNTVDQAVAFVMGKDVKEVKAERLEKEQKRKEQAEEIYQSVLSGDFNDVTLQKINDYIDDATPLHPYGQRISQRLPQKLERGLHEGARTNAVDALFSRICESTVPASRRASEAGRREIEERKKEALKGWAIATNNWHTDLSDFADEEDFIRQGTDSKVYLAKDGKHVIKVSFGKPEGKRFRPDIDTTALFNSVFRNTAYEIVGYGEFEGKFARILKQPFVDFADKTALNADEREEYMRTLGFEPINESRTAFSNGSIVAADLQKSNILKDAAGNISVIDADMKLHTKDVGGNYTYPPVEADLPEGKLSFRVVNDKNGKKTLVGLHNISEDKLRKAIKQGGLANPSMAVIDMDKQSHVDYGDITLIAPSSLIDKKTGKNIGTYTADAWTPIYPNIEKRMSDKGAKAYSESLESVPSELRNKVRLYFNAYLEDGNTSGALNYWFLNDTGKNPPSLTSQSNDYTNEELDAIEAISNAGYYSGLNEEEKQKVLDLFIEKQGGKDAFDARIAKRIETMKNNLQRPDLIAFMKNKVKQKLQEIQEYGYDYEQVSDFYSNAQRAINNRGKIDEFRTFRNAEDIVNNEGLQGEFNEWLADKEEQFGVEEYLFVGYNNNGDRKYLPNTLENASKLMKKEGRAGATGLHGFNHFVATLAPNVGTLAQINKKKGNLSTQEEYYAFREKWGNVYHELAKQLQPDATGYADYGYYRLEEMPNVKNPKEYVKKEYGIELSDEFMKKYNEFVSAIKNDFPARYFETKFERPVYLNEFAAAVIPQGTSKEVVYALTEAGLPIEKYESGNNEARMAAVDKVSSEIGGIRFRFIGERGARNLDKAEEATTRLDNLAVAREMEAAEKDAKTIKMATGWERGADGLWRYETMDSETAIKNGDEVEIRKQIEDIEEEEKAYKKKSREEGIGPDEREEAYLNFYRRRGFLEAQLAYVMAKNADVLTHISTSLHHVLDKTDSDSLFKAYPELEFVKVGFATELVGKSLGATVINGSRIEAINLDVKRSTPEELNGYLAHEIQHAIQEIEGFAPGGDPSMESPRKAEQKAKNISFMKDKLDKSVSERNSLLKQRNEINDKMSAWWDAHEDATREDMLADKDMQQFNREYDELSKQIDEADNTVKFNEKWLDATLQANTALGYEGYKKLAGEVEARNVTSRLGMTLEQRRNSLASETEDVAREDQIFLKDGIESGMRFRLSEKGKQIQAEVDKFTSKYNSKPVRIVEAEMDDNELMETLDYAFELEDVKSFMKESKTAAGYFHNLDKIIIFADKTKVERMEEYLFHENIHAAIHHNNFANLVAHFYEYAKNEAVFEKWSKLAHNKEYKQYNSSEEFLAYVVSNAMVARNLDEVAEYLGEKQKKALNKLFNVIGYDYDIRRRSDEQSVNGRTSEETSGESSLEGNELLNTGEGRGTGEGIGKGKSGKVSAAERKARLNELFNKVADMGLQGVLGNKEYTSLMVDIYKALPEGVRVEIAEDALRLYGGSVAPAVSDYIGPKSKNSIMDKVVTIVREALRKIGFDLDLNANEVRYMAWRSKKPLDRNNMFEVAEDIDMKYRLKIGEYDGTTPDGGGTRFRRVYHGSGASFDKFDHNFMGTGEGNQSFGWGTYVTDSQSVGKQYANVIGGDPVFTYKGMSSSEAYKKYPELQYLAFFMDRGDSAEVAIERRKSILNKVVNTEGADWFRKEMAEKSLEVLDSLDPKEMKMTKNRHLYEVEIPDNDGMRYLSWEEPLTDKQKDRIKKVLTKTDEYKAYTERYGKELSEERVDTWLSAKGGAGRVYRFLENFFEESDNSAKAVSKLLSDAGFVGMEYPANYYGGGNSHGDNNYVIFDENDLEIKEHTRFRVSNKLQVRDEYEATIKKGGYQAREAVQDAMLSLRKFQELIEKASGKKIRDFENAWMHENRLSSVVQAEIHDMERKFYKPMMDAVKKLMSAANLEQEQVADYLMLKHGIERNREMAVRKALTDDKGKIDRTRLEQWYQDKRNVRNRTATPHLDTWRKQQEELDNIALLYGADMSRDYSGLTSMFGTDDLADSTQKSYDEVEALENAHSVETESLGKAVKAMTQNTLDKSFESGLMDRKVYDELSKDMYDYYIPLRGFEETTSEEVYAYLDQDRGAFNAPLKRAKGRSSKSDNPIAYLKSIAESGIMQGNRNKMKQSFLNMVINNPSDLVSVREGVWVIYNPASGEWEAASAPAIPNNATPADVEAAMEAWEQQMEQAAQNDPNIKKVSEAADVPYRVVGNRMDQHQIIVKRLGKSYTLTINGNPRLAMAINGQTNPNNTSNDGKVAAFVNNKIGALNRSLAAWYTTRNPDFVASNFMRDTFYTNTIVRAKEGNAYANKFHKNYATVLPKMLGLFRKYENGTLDPADQTDAAFLDFMMNGGETGYSNLKDVEEIKKQITKALKESKWDKAVTAVGLKALRRENVEALAEKLDILNRAVENTARFAAYLTSREVGRSIAKSVFDAKEISVNFNKKGAGGTFFGMTGQTWFGNLASMVGASGRALYVFFNAAIQGTTNLMHVMKINPKGTSAGLAAMFLMGAVIPFLFDDDDEKDYYDLPEHVRRNHLIIPGTGDAWISIPLPIEYRIMYGMGELLTSWRTGHERGSDIGRKMLNLTGQALPLNFLEEGFDAFIPSALSPVWQVYNNRSWTGLPIYKDNEFNKDDPEYTKAYKNVDRGIYEFTKALYNWTFDEENQKERIDLNPAVIEALARGYFGGLATQLSNIGKTAEIVAGEREFDWRSIPIGNRLFKSGDERTKEKRVTNEYFENMEKLDFLQSRERMLKKTENGIEVPEADKFKAQKDLETMQGTEVYKKYQEFKKQKKVVDKIRKTIKEKGSTPEREKQLIEAQEAANKSVR